MNRRRTICTALMLALAATPVAWAETQKNVQVEIDFLLGRIDESGCQFYRNGSWYDGKSAQAHLRDKVQFLAARNQIASAEDFIEKAATRSSFSGQAYQVSCKGEATALSEQWLRALLARFRMPRAAP